MKTVCIPKENEQDLAEISEEIVGDMEIIPVEHMDQVLRLHLYNAAQILFAGE